MDDMPEHLLVDVDPLSIVVLLLPFDSDVSKIVLSA
jgi:hypothetical protein